MMEDVIEKLMISVRADTTSFARDVSTMRGELEGPLAAGAGRAARMIENALGRAVTGGKVSFDDLRRVALAAFAEMAQASVRMAMGGQGPSSTGSLGPLLAGLLTGLPGRATGGPVDQGRAYVVGERGPELFVPSGAGRVQPIGGASNVQINLSVTAPAGAEAQAFQRSSRQIARQLGHAIASGR